jgi:hypothetical protein
MLVKRFPAGTAAELLQAHAYAYGGCIVQDMGYYPFGNHLFSELTHYVRTGDFIFALVHESKDVNEYAFALGTLALRGRYRRPPDRHEYRGAHTLPGPGSAVPGNR